MALTGVSIQVLAETERILQAFKTISSGGSPGLFSIVKLLDQNRHALLWRIFEAGLLGVGALIFQYFRYRKASGSVKVDEAGDPGSKYLIVGSIGSLAIVALLVKLCDDLVRLLALVVDKNRLAEAERILQGMDLHDVADLVSTCVLVLASSSIAATVFAFVAAFLGLEPRKIPKRGFAITAALASVTFAWIAVASAGILDDIHYLKTLNGQPIAEVVNPASPGKLPFLIADPVARMISVPPPPDIGLIAPTPTPPPPPPPPPRPDDSDR